MWWWEDNGSEGVVLAPVVHGQGVRAVAGRGGPDPLRMVRSDHEQSCWSEPLNLAMDLAWDLSPASYVREHRPRLDAPGVDAVLTAMIDTGAALEEGDPARARRHWRQVIGAAEREGAEARRAGVGRRELVARIGRVRDEIDLILFDGRLPPDLAARASRLAAKMSGRYTDRLLESYWTQQDQAVRTRA